MVEGQVARCQHERLEQHLRQKWPNWDVKTLPIVIGSFGTMRSDTAAHLALLGVRKDDIPPLLQGMKLATINYTFKVMRAHRTPNKWDTFVEAQMRKAKRKAQKAAERRAKRARAAAGDADYAPPALMRQKRLPNRDAAPSHAMATRSKRRRGDAVLVDGGVRPGQLIGRKRAGVPLNSASLKVATTETSPMPRAGSKSNEEYQSTVVRSRKRKADQRTGPRSKRRILFIRDVPKVWRMECREELKPD